MPSVTWRVYYSNGTTFDNTQGGVEQVPPLGVLVIAQANPMVGRVLIQGGDYYWMDKGEWFGGDVAGMYTYIVRQGLVGTDTQFDSPFDMLRFVVGTGKVKLGEMVRWDVFEDTYHRAYDDPDLPRKSAYHPREKKVVD